ncbi:MAG TPA: response regulator transcription factor [Bdellovibrionales bacterium]|nr:response regulator transcription factor [Bdellovibrionales bacterium]
MAFARILIVEDEARLLAHLQRILSENGFSVFTCESYRDLENMLAMPLRRFDLILLDRLLHNRDSVSLLKAVREGFPETKIMILSAINTAAEKALLLDQGADDYLEKPFDSEELIARIRALLRRGGRSSLVFGNVALDSDNRSMKIGDQWVSLPNKEFVLLRTLVQNPGKVFSKAFLHEQVWEMSSEVESNVVEATVNKLRRRLKDAGASVQIKNMRNSGYWIEE